MLKLTPRSITAGILLFFLFLHALEHASYLFLREGAALQSILRDGVSRDESVHRWTLEGQQRFQSRIQLLTWLDRVDYDLHLTLRPQSRPNPAVVVVDVNEKTLQDLGQFPFSRKIYKTLIERLEADGAKVIGFDLTFPERERNATLEELTALRENLITAEGFDSRSAAIVQERLTKLDADQEFGLALRQAKIPIVAGFAFSNEEGEPAGEQLTALSTKTLRRRQIDDGALLSMLSDKIPVLPHLDLLNSLKETDGIGAFTADADNDSVIRRAPGVLYYRGFVLPSLAVATTARYLGTAPELTAVPSTAIRDASGTFNLPLSPSGSALLRFYGSHHSFPYFTFSDVLMGRLPPGTFKDKLVFVGVSAVGLRDIRATPYSSNYPGVEVHATLASNILNHEFLEKDGRYFWWGYLFLLVGCLATSYCVFVLHPLGAFAVGTVLTAILQFSAQAFFFNRGVVVPSLLPSFACFTAFFAGLLYRYFNEEREKRMVRTAFSRYVSGAVVEEILKDQTKLRLGGQKKQLTVMFVDLVGFTKLSERLDAAFVTTLLNEYFTRMTLILQKNRGTLDKYMGDGLMCFWGAPLELPDHAQLACATAVEMREELAKINHEWTMKHGISIENRIGIHTGDMAVGNMGSDQVFSYTVMGDNVNLGSRLEGVNTVYGTHVIVSSSTAAQAGSAFLFRPLDKVQVKGRSEAVEIFELLGRKEAKEPEWIHAFRVGLGYYQRGEWDEAEAAFGACLTLKPDDTPSQVFKDRIRDFRIVAPEEWNGTWRLSSK
jgi:adenylate cyclase